MPKPTLNIIPFSHLDLFWAGSREECLSRGGRVISTALDLLEKYPQYRFMIESTNFLETYLDCRPERREAMRCLAQSGQLEIIPMRSIIYSHLPSGETAIRNLLYGKEFCREQLGISPTIMSMSDIPGCTPQTPQIAALAGMTEVVLSRGFKPHTDHVKWRGLDGTAIRAYCPWHYANLAMAISYEDYNEMLKYEAQVEEYVAQADCPQICHWGMDLYILNENIFHNIARWNREGHRQLFFSTFREFFDATSRVERPEISGGIPSIWPHIESSWPDLWPLDVPAETALARAEFFGALSVLAGDRNDYPREEIKQAWLKLLDSMDHNQNGCGGDSADADKLQLKQLVTMLADSWTQKYAWRLAAKATAPRADTFPIVVFNPLSWRRSGIVRARGAGYGSSYSDLFDGAWRTNTDPYRSSSKRNFRLLDASGNEVPFKLESHLKGCADVLEISFFVSGLPGFGAQVFYLEMAEPAKFDSPFTITRDRDEDKQNCRRYLGCDLVENRFFKLEIKRLTGEFSLFDKRSGRTLIRDAAIIGLEERRGEYITCMELSGRIMPAILNTVEITADNAVYAAVEITGSVYGQRFIQKLTLAADKATVDIENRIFWQGERYVRIEQSFPFVSEERGVITYGVPFGQERYPETIYHSPTDGPDPEANPEDPTTNIRLVREWVDISDSINGITIGSDHRMWTFAGNTLRNCMVRGIGWTSGGYILEDDLTERAHQRPPCGEYVFRYRLEPHPAAEAVTGQIGWELNQPMHCVAVADYSLADKPGIDLPELPDTSASSVIISWVKIAEDGEAVILRCFEAAGKKAQLDLPQLSGRQYLETDFSENGGKAVSKTLHFRPFEIKTIKIITNN